MTFNRFVSIAKVIVGLPLSNDELSRPTTTTRVFEPIEPMIGCDPEPRGWRQRDRVLSEEDMVIRTYAQHPNSVVTSTAAYPYGIPYDVETYRSYEDRRKQCLTRP